MNPLKRAGLLIFFGGLFYFAYNVGGWPYAAAYAFASFYLEFIELNTKK